MRIVAGRYRSRRLKVGPPPGTRPTSDRLRETLFNILGPRILESRFVDAYAGVGAVGIEALSRGASEVLFIDRAVSAARAIRENLAAFGITEACRVVRMDAARAYGIETDPFDIIFMDPPYGERDLYLRDLATIDARRLLADGGVVIAEHARSRDLPLEVGGLGRVRVYTQGDSGLSFFEQETE